MDVFNLKEPSGNSPLIERSNSMQLRCTYCQTMFAISREEKLIAIQNMNAENLQYYHADCPKCRRANRVERIKLERSYPNWQADLKTLADNAPEEDQTAASQAGAKK
jgi:phage FluMu protein Com